MQRAADLPEDAKSLKQLLIASRSALAVARAQLRSRDLEIETLRLQLARLRRLQFGQSSERLNETIAQLELTLEELEAAEASAPSPERSTPTARTRPVRRALPAHLPRERIVHAPLAGESDCSCPECGATMRALGEDVAEVLEYVPSHWKVLRHVRPKLSCTRCQRIVQAAAPSRAIERGLAGPGLLAHVLVSKYCDHLPLYRQSQIFAREGIDLDRSTLADWVGQCTALMQPLLAALEQHVISGSTLHADDNPGAGARSGHGQNEDRAAVDVRAR